MSGPRSPRSGHLPTGRTEPNAALVPCLLLSRGHICRPGNDGPEIALSAAGEPFDPFDVIDRIIREHSLLYMVDLDGIERGEPQLDYIQEFSRDIALWVDAGVHTADQSIDIIVAGAQRAVVSSGELEGPEELERAWSLTTELVFEVVFEGGKLRARREWAEEDPVALARTVRGIGPDHFVVSPRDTDPPWPIVRSIAAEGPTWVDGTFVPRDAPRLTETGAAGGIFHIEAILDAGPRTASAPDPRPSPNAVRDDEDQNQLNSDE